MEFSGPTSFALRNNNTTYKASRETTLCTQIAAKQPLALSLAKRVKTCHFTHWDNDQGWAVRPFVEKYLSGMVHMTNICQLKFSDSFVDKEHWDAIATLQSLQDLSFDWCKFLRGPADAEPEKRVKLKVSRLQVTKCVAHCQAFAAIDPRYLRTLAVDHDVVVSDYIDWLPKSALTEFIIHLGHVSWVANKEYIKQTHAMLMQAPQSIEALSLPLGVHTGSAQGRIRSMFHGPAWKNLPLLRSLTLDIRLSQGLYITYVS